MGAIQAAVGSQQAAAKACVAGLTGVSSANVVFGSSGKVKSVAVSGAAAGKPAEACIRRAYMKAAVGPFMKPTYSVKVNIRP